MQKKNHSFKFKSGFINFEDYIFYFSAILAALPLNERK